MPSNHVKVGRLVRILRGPRTGKVAVITAIVDANRVLVENPEDKKMWRHVQNMKNIEPTKFTVKVGTNANSKDVKKALDAKKVLAKVAKTSKSKQVTAAAALAASTDFERYQLRVAKRARANAARKIFAENDAKKPVSWNMKTAKKLEKVSAKFVKKHADKVKAYAAKKAKKAAAKKAKK